MIVVTLFCVLFGGVMARVGYLKGMAAHHQLEADRLYDDVVIIMRQTGQNRYDGTFGVTEADDERVKKHIYHALMAIEFRDAAYRPWTCVWAPHYPPELVSACP